VSSVRLKDEVGVASAGIWCPHHTVPSVVHAIGEPTGEEDVNALQRFVQTYKQADLSLTGTLRRAAYVQQSVSASRHSVPLAGHRRASAVNGVTAPAPATKDTHKNTRASPEEATDEMAVDTENHAPTQIIGTEATRKCTRCSTTYSPRWWPIDKSRRTTTVDHRPPLLNGTGMNESRFPPSTSASPPYLHRRPSQHGLTKLNGEYSPADKNGPANSVDHQNQDSYECHKCHLKQIPAQPSPEPRPSPYSAQRPVLPAPRLPEYHNHPYGPPHAHPQTGVLPRPLGPPPTNGPEWYPGYEQRPADYGDKLRNAIPVANYRGGPPPPPAHHMNGFQPTPPHHAPPHHYPSGAHPPPQPFPAHQSPYGPVSIPSPHLSHPAGPRPYAPSASPPDVHSTMVRHSPQHSLSALNGGPPARVYSVDRVISAPTQSPPVSQAHVDPRGRTSPGRLDDTPITASTGPVGSSRRPNVNGTNGGSGASASPSLKNLLS
jgi:hypothetical protein